MRVEPPKSHDFSYGVGTTEFERLPVVLAQEMHRMKLHVPGRTRGDRRGNEIGGSVVLVPASRVLRSGALPCPGFLSQLPQLASLSRWHPLRPVPTIAAAVAAAPVSRLFRVRRPRNRAHLPSLQRRARRSRASRLNRRPRPRRERRSGTTRISRRRVECSTCSIRNSAVSIRRGRSSGEAILVRVPDNTPRHLQRRGVSFCATA